MRTYSVISSPETEENESLDKPDSSKQNIDTLNIITLKNPNWLV